MVTDGVVRLRPPGPGDAALLVAGRDAQFHRFLGPGAPAPAPSAVVEVDGAVAGWVDADRDPEHDWLGPGEVNVGYHLFAPLRGRGLASRAVALLLHRLAVTGAADVASVLIDPANAPSLALAGRLGFVAAGGVGDQRLLRRPVPPLTYTDGVVTLRRRTVDDLDRDLEAKDAEQQRWLWLPGQPEAWAALTAADQREHARRGLEADAAGWGTGPKWTFAVDAGDEPSVAYVDCDLANEHVPAGEANVSYSTHPAFRGRGYATRAVGLIVRFLADHTAAREAHVLVDPANAASMAVARAAGAAEVERTTLARHVLVVPYERSSRRFQG